jgi:hypothetical protein
MKAYEDKNSFSHRQLVIRLADLADQGRALYRQLLPGLSDEERRTENGTHGVGTDAILGGGIGLRHLEVDDGSNREQSPQVEGFGRDAAGIG